MTRHPERIWLLPGAGGETLWCDNPAPGIEMDEADAVEYVRANLQATLRGLQAKNNRLRDLMRQAHAVMRATG